MREQDRNKEQERKRTQNKQWTNEIKKREREKKQEEEEEEHIVQQNSINRRGNFISLVYIMIHFAMCTYFIINLLYWKP